MGYGKFEAARNNVGKVGAEAKPNGLVISDAANE